MSGQSQPTAIDVYTDAVASASAVPDTSNDGLLIKINNCRSPHIVQFEYRERIAADGTHIGGIYKETNGQSFPLTVDPTHQINWHTDTSGAPNAYYDQQDAVPVVSTPLSLNFFDQPNFGGDTYQQGAHETWRVSMVDEVIFNCQIAREVHWTRQVLWVPDPSNPGHGKQNPIQYVDVLS